MSVWLFIMACSESAQETGEPDSIEEQGDDVEEPTDIPVRMLKCRLQEINVLQDSGGQQYSYQTSYTWSGNQMSFDGGMYIYNDHGYVLTMISSQQDWQQSIQNDYACDVWCQLLSTTTETTSSGTTSSYETIYEWDGNTQYTEDEHYYEYNDYGYLVEAYTQQNGVTQQVLYSYDCDDWCRLTTIRTISNETEEVVEHYEWNGNTVSHSNGYDMYNEYGYITESFLEATTTSTLTQYSYDCNP